MYNTPIGGVSAGLGGTAAAATAFGPANALWLGLGAFALVSAAIAVKRILPKFAKKS